MATNIVSLRELDEYISHTPPLTHDIVTKALSRETDMISKQYEIYDILIQSTEQASDTEKQGYYTRAHKIDPHYTRFLYNNYYNTDILDLNEFILQIPKALDEYDATKIFVKINGESHYKKTATWDQLQLLLKDYISEQFIQLIDQRIQDLGKNNLYTISLSINPSGLLLRINAATDNDGDVMEKIDPDATTKNDYHYPFPMSFDQTYKIASFIRRWSGEKGDIRDCFVFE